MALDVTVGAETANSYVSLEKADEYHASRVHTEWTEEGTAWGDFVNADREAALVRATDWVDKMFGYYFRGSPTNGRNQSLAWPRQGATDSNGVQIDANEIPREVVKVTLELALLDLAEPGVLNPNFMFEQAKLKETVGPISVTYAETSTGTRTENARYFAYDTLRPILRPKLYPVYVV